MAFGWFLVGVSMCRGLCVRCVKFGVLKMCIILHYVNILSYLYVLVALARFVLTVLYGDCFCFLAMRHNMLWFS